MESAELIAKKHSIVYIRLLLSTGLVVGFLLLLSIAKDMQPYSRWIFLLAAVVLLRAVLRWLRLRSIAWAVRAEAVVVKGGWLPWKRYSFDIPIDTLLEAYYSIGFWAKLFNYGHCTIRRTEGTTSSFHERYLTRPQQLVGLINQKVKEFKKRSGRPGVTQPASAVDQLKDLATLKADGSITGAEYEVMKQRIITRVTAPGSRVVDQ